MWSIPRSRAFSNTGYATFDTEEHGTVTVEAGEIIRFAPGDFQHGYDAADSDEPVTMLALGAVPRDGGDDHHLGV